MKYWNSVQANRKLHVVNSVQEGFKKLEIGQTIFHIQSGVLKGAMKQSPHLVPNMQTFGGTKPTYYCALFTKNSPLVPLFMKAAIETFENGQYDHISQKWQGADIKSSEVGDFLNSYTLTVGQVFLIFAILSAMITGSFFCLICECFYFKILKKN